MNNGSTAGFLTPYDAHGADSGMKGRKMILQLKALPWVRIIVDALLVAGIVLASSSFLSVR